MHWTSFSHNINYVSSNYYIKRGYSYFQCNGLKFTYAYNFDCYGLPYFLVTL